MRTVLAAAALILFTLCDAQADSAGQRQFAAEMARVLLGSTAEFITLGNGEGERGFLLAQPGSTVAPISEAYSGLQGDFTQSLADAVVFDRPVSALDGVAIFRSDSLADIWKEILEDARPGFSLTKDRALDERTMKWLFRKNPGQKDPSKKYSREPSDYYKRYTEFEKKYALLLAARQGEVWKSIPAFSGYKTFDVAERGLLNDWFKSGYKAEIESAMWQFSAAVPFVEWQNWAKTNTQYESNMIPYGEYLKLPVTRLFPPPASWSAASMWFRGTSSDVGREGEYRFQFARVQIIRPWMNLQALLSGQLTLGQRDRPPLIVSDGNPSSSNSLPSGVLGSFVEELVLVRNITYQGPSGTGGSHPLSYYAYPDAINVLGYIVHSLPKIPNGKN